ncbi:MAG TPA: VWA domain-containing protein [Vicinamibacterales bacterium]|jgi:VWFA-related protein
MKTAFAFVLVLATGAAAVGQQQPSSVFRTGADIVTVEASVRRDRRPVIGLKAADFELLDNGVPQEITDISFEKLPIDVTVVLDVSASVTGAALDELRRALRQFRADLGKQDRLRLMTFNMRVRRLVDFTDAAGAADTALASLAGSGSSAIFDSLAVALASHVPPGRRQLIVLFSDGQDSSSIIDADVLLDVARRSTPTVAIVLASSSLQRPASLVRTAAKLSSATVGDMAEQIASDTGGFVATITPGENLTSTFRRVLEQFRTSYVLYFTPRGVERQGSHTLDVRVKNAKVEIRARRGYVWR